MSASPELWRHPDFLKLWSGQTVSTFGSTITREALPYAAVLLLGASPWQMGVLAAAASAPVLVVSLFVGAWTDRLRRRPLLVAADVGRAVLLLSVPVAALTGRLHLGQLFAVAALVGVLTVLFDVAYQSYVPGLVGQGQLVAANSMLSVSASLAEVTAPGAAGVLVQALTAPFAIVVDALSFLWSALMVRLIRARELPMGRSHDHRPSASDLLEGARHVRRHPLLCAFAATACTSGIFGNFFATLYALFGLRVLGLSPAMLGLTVAMGGAGGLVGAAFAGPLARRYGLGPLLLGVALIGRLVSFLIPMAGGPPLVAMAMLMAAQAVGDGTHEIYTIHVTSLRQAVTPSRLLGRVNATMYLVSEGVAPLGALAGGVLAQLIGIRPTVYVAVVGGMLGMVWLLLSPVGQVRELPALGAPAEGDCVSGRPAV